MTVSDPNLDELKTALRALRKETRRRGMPLSMIGKIKTVEAIVDEVKKKRG
jgi:hypothetical protein